MSLKHRFAGYADLLRHYRATFSHYWGRRKELDGGLFNQQEAEFLPSVMSLQERPLSPIARLLAWTLMALVVVVITWSIMGKVDIVVNATGKIIPNQRTKTIGSVDVASVKALHVEEGQSVKAGDVLIELDTGMPDAERDKAEGDVVASKLQMARSRALITAVDTLSPPRMPQVTGVSDDKWQAAKSHLEGQYLDFIAKLNKLDGDIQKFEQALPLATQQAKDFKSLSEDHDVSTHAYLDKEQARIDLEGQLIDARNQRASLIAETRRQAYDTLTEGSKAVEESKQDVIRAASHSKLLKLTSPVDGTVQQLTVHTVGGVVPAAQPLMVIVPKENFTEVEAFMQNKDIGFVQEGQRAEVKVDAFEYTKYGTVPARVTHVSHDAIQDQKKGLIYSVKVTMDRSSMMVDGQEKPLTAGMSVNVEIKTGTRRVIEYVLSPLLEHIHESINER
ncbi:MAG TPA: HlyD family type I secretion periplasmic adaptor subunit [Methylophilaceae bacterium]|jgi:hemolysin D